MPAETVSGMEWVGYLPTRRLLPATLVIGSVKIVVLEWVLVLFCALNLGAAFGGELTPVLPVLAPAGFNTFPAGFTRGPSLLAPSPGSVTGSLCRIQPSTPAFRW